jgi:hypothetical protein
MVTVWHASTTVPVVLPSPIPLGTSTEITSIFIFLCFKVFICSITFSYIPLTLPLVPLPSSASIISALPFSFLREV